jgi:hypothetical protein
MRKLSPLEQANSTYLSEQDIEFSFLLPTPTGLHKSIMDAVAPLREYLFQKQAHDYAEQAQGQEHKRCLDAVIVGEREVHRSLASLYRPITKKGDPRIWFRGLKSCIAPDEILAIVANGNMLYALNLSSSSFLERISSDHAFNAILSELRPSRALGATAQELLSKLRGVARSGFIPAECSGSTAIGRTLESALGIAMNSSKEPDYKGIELKSKRKTSATKHSLFAQVPDWKLSSLKSIREFLDAYGYEREGLRRLNCTVNALTRNSQGLKLAVEYGLDLLLENGLKDGKLKKDVLVWSLPSLRGRLAQKHKETFWVTGDSRIRNGREEFLFKRVEYTRSPRVYQFSDLLATGLMIVDHEIKAVGNGVKERGPAFKTNKAGHKLLFPSPIQFDLI